MGYHPRFTITPALLVRVETIAALRERTRVGTFKDGRYVLR